MTPKKIIPATTLFLSPELLERIERKPELPDRFRELIIRHRSGDWGVLPVAEHATNREALDTRSRVISAFPIDAKLPATEDADNIIWIVTHDGWEETVLLLPHEF